jgi:UDP-glucose 4-epimerase
MISVLVTGGAGYIGSHVLLALVDAGLRPVVIDDLSTGSRDAIPSGVPFFLGNASEGSLIERAVTEHGVSAVLHFAGSIIVPESFQDPLGYYYNNTVVSHALIRACLNFNVRNIVFSSTAAVYGEPKSLPVGEEAAVHPHSPYGQSKLMTEQIIRDTAHAQDLRYVILRYFNVAGADPQGRAGLRTRNATHLIKMACDVALGREKTLKIYGSDYSTPDGTGIRDYIHVSDLADAHVRAVRHLAEGRPSCTLNCGYGHGYSVREVVAAFERVTGKPLRAELLGRREGDAAAVIASADLLRRTLGWVPRYDDLETIVRTSLEWERRRR